MAVVAIVDPEIAEKIVPAMIDDSKAARHLPDQPLDTVNDLQRKAAWKRLCPSK
jgi:hypothetical protein